MTTIQATQINKLLEQLQTYCQKHQIANVVACNYIYGMQGTPREIKIEFAIILKSLCDRFGKKFVVEAYLKAMELVNNYEIEKPKNDE